MERSLLASDCRQKIEQAKSTARRLLGKIEEQAESKIFDLDESVSSTLPLALTTYNIIAKLTTIIKTPQPK
jgi:hypothetical protein